MAMEETTLPSRGTTARASDWKLVWKPGERRAELSGLPHAPLR